MTLVSQDTSAAMTFMCVLCCRFWYCTELCCSVLCCRVLNCGRDWLFCVADCHGCADGAPPWMQEPGQQRLQRQPAGCHWEPHISLSPVSTAARSQHVSAARPQHVSAAHSYIPSSCTALSWHASAALGLPVGSAWNSPAPVFGPAVVPPWCTRSIPVAELTGSIPDSFSRLSKLSALYVPCTLQRLLTP